MMATAIFINKKVSSMKRKILSVFVLAALVLTLFAGCEAATKPTTVTNITPEEAYEIIYDALGITQEQMLSPFVHYGEHGDPPESAYSIQFATLEKDYIFIISAIDGDIMYRSDEAEQ